MAPKYYVVAVGQTYLKMKRQAQSFFGGQLVFEEGLAGALPFVPHRGVTPAQAQADAQAVADKYNGAVVMEVTSEAGGVSW